MPKFYFNFPGSFDVSAFWNVHALNEVATPPP